MTEKNIQSFIVSTILIGLELQKENIFGNKNRSKILALLKEREFKISEIQNKLNINYKTVWDHVNILEKQRMVTLEKKDKEPGKPVYVKLNPEIKKYVDNPDLLDKEIKEMLSK